MAPKKDAGDSNSQCTRVRDSGPLRHRPFKVARWKLDAGSSLKLAMVCNRGRPVIWPGGFRVPGNYLLDPYHQIPTLCGNDDSDTRQILIQRYPVAKRMLPEVPNHFSVNLPGTIRSEVARFLYNAITKIKKSFRQIRA